MDKMLPLLSDSFRESLQIINNKYDNNISKFLCYVDGLIEGYNRLRDQSWGIKPEDPFIEFVTQSVSEKVNTKINDSARMLSMREGEFEVGFLPKGKDPEYNGKLWSRSNRQSGKPTRIIRRLIVDKSFTDQDYEIFNNQLKAVIDCDGEFRIVSGEVFSHWYYVGNYWKDSGTLGNSCMKHDYCHSYFGIYEDLAKMLILVKDELLLGRAILWEIDGQTYMDRVYVCLDHLENRFIQYAQDNKWIYRSHQGLLSDGCQQKWVSPKDGYIEYEALNLTIKLEKTYDYFPYMDTFRYYNEDDNYITTVPEKNTHTLSITEGSLVDMETAQCEGCGYTERYYEDDDPDSLYWSEIDDCYYCENCAVYSDTWCTYINHSRAVLVIKQNGYEDYAYSDLVDEDDDFVMIDDVIYHKECGKIVFNTKTEEWELV